MNCEPACTPEHWCTYCILDGLPLTHAIAYSDVSIKGRHVGRYSTCAEHYGREIPPDGVMSPFDDEDNDDDES